MGRFILKMYVFGACLGRLWPFRSRGVAKLESIAWRSETKHIWIATPLRVLVRRTVEANLQHLSKKTLWKIAKIAWLGIWRTFPCVFLERCGKTKTNVHISKAIRKLQLHFCASPWNPQPERRFCYTSRVICPEMTKYWFKNAGMFEMRRQNKAFFKGFLT